VGLGYKNELLRASVPGDSVGRPVATAQEELATTSKERRGARRAGLAAPRPPDVSGAGGANEIVRELGVLAGIVGRREVWS